MDKLPASVDKVIQGYVSQLNAIKPVRIIGVYLTGSVSLGDYYTNKSDIDFITVTPSLKRADATLKCMEWFITEFNETYNRR